MVGGGHIKMRQLVAAATVGPTLSDLQTVTDRQTDCPKRLKTRSCEKGGKKELAYLRNLCQVPCTSRTLKHTTGSPKNFK